MERLLPLWLVFKEPKKTPLDYYAFSYSKGVLDRIPGQQDEYFIAPPLLPPAAAVLLDLDSSEILVLATKPNYDLDELTPYISQSTYDEIQRRKLYFLELATPGYAPASPFKLVTALAGIRQGVLKPNQLLPCEGNIKEWNVMFSG